MKGYINSIQTLGTLDGPGIRYILFLQGCPLRCHCCHNPETWNLNDFTEEKSAEEILSEIKRYSAYFGKEGGVTVSGGEALMQPEFVFELFSLCKKEDIHTCIDTSGCIITDSVKKLLSVTDLVLLDIKYTNEEDYKKYTGGSLKKTMEFLKLLKEMNIPAWIRQVIIPDINDTEENILQLKKLTAGFDNIKKIELLPFKKFCNSKYENLKIEFPFKEKREPTKEEITKLELILNKER